jgi:hypothetical protein
LSQQASEAALMAASPQEHRPTNNLVRRGMVVVALHQPIKLRDEQLHLTPISPL